MFLGCLKDNGQKEFFYNLAMIVSIAEGSVDRAINYRISIDPSEAKDFLNKVRTSRQVAGLINSGFTEEMVGKVLGSTDTVTYDIERDRYRSSTYSASESFLNVMISEEESIVLKGFFKEMNIDEYDANRYSDKFKEELNELLVDSISNFKSDKDVKKKVIALLLDHDLDIGDQSVVDNLTMYTDEVRKDVLDKLLTKNIPTVKDLNLSVVQAKAIVFELAAIGYADTRFEGYEVSVVESINAALGLDEEYLEEAREIIARITEAASEASDLIHE